MLSDAVNKHMEDTWTDLDYEYYLPPEQRSRPHDHRQPPYHRRRARHLPLREDIRRRQQEQRDIERQERGPFSGLVQDFVVDRLSDSLPHEVL